MGEEYDFLTDDTTQGTASKILGRVWFNFAKGQAFFFCCRHDSIKRR